MDVVCSRVNLRAIDYRRKIVKPLRRPRLNFFLHLSNSSSEIMTEVAHSLTHTVRSRKSSKGIAPRKPHPPVALVTPRTERKCDQTRIDEDGASDYGLCGDGTGSDKVVTPTSDEAELYFSGNLQLSSVM